MKCVHEATHVTEAHMFLHLLEQEGFHGRVDGEYLQGAVGELPAGGLIRVMVSDEDYEKASAFLTEWHAQQISCDEKDETKVKNDSTTLNYVTLISLCVVLAGFLIACIFLFPSSPLQEDLNGDGKVDAVYFLNADGSFDQNRLDRNFDGIFETTEYYKDNELDYKETDTDGNKIIDLRHKYEHSLLKEIEFLGPDGKLIIKKQKFGPFKLESAQFDSDSDGILDTLYEYDVLEEIKAKVSIKPRLSN
jgi:hypothetical protein